LRHWNEYECECVCECEYEEGYSHAPASCGSVIHAIRTAAGHKNGLK